MLKGIVGLGRSMMSGANSSSHIQHLQNLNSNSQQQQYQQVPGVTPLNTVSHLGTAISNMASGLMDTLDQQQQISKQTMLQNLGLETKI